MAITISGAGITSAQIQADGIDGSKIADDAIDSEHIASGGVDDAHIASGVDASKLTTGTLPAARISSLDATKLTGTIASGRLSAANLGSGTVPTARLGSGTANNSVFLRGDSTWATAGSTSASDLTSGTLPIARIADDAITNAKMADDAIDSAQIADDAINTAHIGAEQITETKMASNSIDSHAYVDGSIEDVHLATGITASKLTGALPAISGANLTGIVSNFSSLTDTTVSTVDPTITTNPSAIGHIWFNKTSGDIFTCTRNTSNENVWINAGDSGKNIRYQKTNGTSDLFGDGSDKLHLQFNEPLASAGTIRDYSGNFTCTAHQNVDFTKDSMFSSYAAKFNGNGEITIPFMSNTFRRTDEFTISIWITRKGDIPDGTLPFSFNGNTSTNGRGVRVTGNNAVRVSTTAANSMYGNLGATFTVNDGDHFVLIGHSNATSTLYKNGSAVGTSGVATSGHSNVSNSAGGCLGGIGNVYNPTGFDGHRYFECTVNNFRIFDKAVSSSEVATLYAEGY